MAKIDVDSKQHGGHIVARVLKAHNVRFVFTLCGGHVSPIISAFEQFDIRVIGVRDEKNAVFAADAVSRVSGIIGVAIVTAGPGVTNTVTAMKNAHVSGTPLLLIGGNSDGFLYGRGALQDNDQMSMLRPMCKYSARVTRVCDIVPIFCRAINEAFSDTPGPVFIDFPIDSQYPYSLVRSYIGIVENPKNWRTRLNNWYFEYYLKNLFFKAFEKVDVLPLPIRIPKPCIRHLTSAADIIMKAKRPMMIIGDQAMLHSVSTSDFAESVKTLNIPCYLQGIAKGILGRFNEILFRYSKEQSMAEADVVILAGVITDYILGYGKYFQGNTKVIIINRNKTLLYLNSDMYWTPTLAIEADVALSICGIAQILQQKKHTANHNAWINTLKNRENLRELKIKKKGTDAVEININPLSILNTLEEEGLTEDSIVVTDGGDFETYSDNILRPRGPLKWRNNGTFGTLGVGGGFALGLKLCKPDCDVWLIYGDGSLGYSLLEQDTFARHKLGIISVVGNNGMWSLTSRYQLLQFGNNNGCQLDFTRYDIAADGLGGKGILVDTKNCADLKKIFTNSIEISRKGIPVLLNCMIGTVDFD